MNTYDDWWSSLKVTEKERIASKIAKRPVNYPECTTIWAELPEDRKTTVFEHCTDKHGLILKDWFDGTPYGD